MLTAQHTLPVIFAGEQLHSSDENTAIAGNRNAAAAP